MIEIIAAILTILSALLATFGKRSTWKIGILSSLCYMWFFSAQNLWGMFILQILMIFQSIRGDIFWKYLKIKKIGNENLTKNFLGITSLFVPVAFMLLAENFSWIELIVCWFSLIANWMLTKGDPRSWHIWNLVNFTSILLFTLQMWSPISALTYSILLINSIIATWKWYHTPEKRGRVAFY